ncbi:hypothetical protein VKT23_018247 [Stygiomarasmius scandens]|uniref:Uncharacterized protein n=1 Tax=Marasmiellus scandens TaxID=2682957 RepID=A0ABR1IPU7_9AGAR
MPAPTSAAASIPTIPDSWLSRRSQSSSLRVPGSRSIIPRLVKVKTSIGNLEVCGTDGKAKTSSLVVSSSLSLSFQ